ncbi:MAG: MMPL family transporter [Gammaproteobacteria bacterium]
MSSRLEARAATVIEGIVAWCVRRRWRVLIGFGVVAVLAARLTVEHVAINTDTADMLAAELPWRRAYAEYQRAFPWFDDSLVVVIDAPTPDLADEASRRLSQALLADAAHFTDVFNPRAEAFLRRHQFLYLETAELERLADDLAGAQVLLGRLAADPGLNGLLALIGDIVDNEAEQAPVRLATVLTSIAARIDAFLAGDTTPLSWQRLLGGSALDASTRVVFTVQPRIDYTSLLPAGEAIAAVRTAAAALGYGPGSAVEVRLTGAAALGYDELYSVMHGAERGGLAAFAIVTACLVIGLGSLSLVVATLVTLIVGLLLTACFAALAVGTLNMISIAFAVLYVGLGVDFAIHVCLRYRELSAGRAKRDAILATARHMGVSLALCALTTALGFLAFLPTSYRGVAELGLIAGVGIVIGLVVSLTLLPVMLEILPAVRARAHARTARLLERTTAPRHASHVVVFALFAAAAAAVTLPHARFDHNPVHLNDQQAESVRTFEDLAREGAVYTIEVLEPDAPSARRRAAELSALPSVASVTSAADLVPAAQDEKLALIGDLAFTMGGVLTVGNASPLQPATIEARLGTLVDALRAATPAAPLQPAYVTLATSLARLRERVATLSAARAHAELAALETVLMHHFPAQVEQLDAALAADAVTLADLPAALLRRWISADGRYRLEVAPRDDLDDNAALEHFVSEVRNITGPQATGTPVINVEASRAVTQAFYQAFATAGACIALLLWVILRRLREVAVVLAPLLLAGLLTTAFSVLFSVPFNFANIIALPLLMGIGVDSALHILHRYKTTGRDDVALMASSSARAVLFSALTTTASFGNLALSPHAGTASMGVMLSVGLAMTIVCTLVVLPALLRRYVQPTGSLT